MIVIAGGRSGLHVLRRGRGGEHHDATAGSAPLSFFNHALLSHKATHSPRNPGIGLF